MKHQPLTLLLEDGALIPVIYANGKDDDVPGFIAAAQNKPVMFDNEIFEPGKDIFIYQRRMLFSRYLCVCGPDSDVDENEYPYPWIIIRTEDGNSRNVMLKECTFDFSLVLRNEK